MISGVGALHNEGLVHKDIKTANILINEDMKLVVCDFGLVEKVPENKTITRGGGTPSTWAPEVASKKPFNCSADWWSIGIVIY
jgi:serine/threonine protein kinase